jgi:hypothetical protein
VTVRPEHRKTFPTARIPETLMMFIRLRGGEHAAINSASVYVPLADYYELSEEARQLSTGDYYMGPVKAGRAWDSEVNVAVKELKKDGYLVSSTGSGKSVWRLTPHGVERADFWLKRMTEKTANLHTLKVDADLVWLDTGDAPKKRELT